MAPQRSPCSVVLEGGVTSAVIYASLLASLSRDYEFRQLGGASSGAVAAAAAAAAEFSRQHGAEEPDKSFRILAQFPDTLAATDRTGCTTLFRLFQPKPKGLASFGVAMAALDRRGDSSLWARARRVALALVNHFSTAALLVAIPVLVIGWIVAEGLSSHLTCGPAIDRMVWCATVWTAALLPTAAAAALALVLWSIWVTVVALRENDWGLCSGMTVTESGFTQHALTPTLHAFFQQLAQLPESAPLTLGDLWWGPRPADGTPRQRSAERRIDLQIITSAVTLARPVRLPGHAGANPLQEFFFDPEEWSALFPCAIVEHLEAHTRGTTLRHDDGRTLLSLPEPEDWPVLMVARFSLSFPLLLSALPMYIAVPRRKMLRAGAAATHLPFEARKVYLSDGGITSNCPVHLFDAPLPGFPTFAINLFRQPTGSRRRVVRSDTRDPELEAAATPNAASWTTPFPFLFSIVSTMFGWRDSLQRSLPGYRERVVHVGVTPETGGLNLAMTPETIRKLGRLGRLAAGKLRNDFSMPHRAGQANAWERHRWIRARTTLAALRAYLAAFRDRLPTGDPDYDSLLRTATPVRHAFHDDAARQQALDLVQGARELMQDVEATFPADALDRNAPQPRPGLHLSPPW